MKGIKTTSVETTLEIVAIGLEAIPFVGGVLGSVISFALGKRKDQRIQDFVIELVEDLKKTADQINQGFVNREM